MDNTLKPPRSTGLSPNEAREGVRGQFRAFFRRNALGFLIVALGWLMIQDVFGTHGVLAMHGSQIELQKIQHEIDQLDEENKKLQDHVRDLKSDPVTIERIAREDMGLARPGEIIFKTGAKPADPLHLSPEPKKP